MFPFCLFSSAVEFIKNNIEAENITQIYQNSFLIFENEQQKKSLQWNNQ